MAIQLFGANLDDYLHLLLPPVVKLFDAPDVPLQARKSVWKSSALFKLHKKLLFFLNKCYSKQWSSESKHKLCVATVVVGFCFFYLICYTIYKSINKSQLQVNMNRHLQPMLLLWYEMFASKTEYINSKNVRRLGLIWIIRELVGWSKNKKGCFLPDWSHTWFK